MSSEERWWHREDYSGFKSRSVCSTRPVDEDARFHQMVGLILQGKHSDKYASDNVKNSQETCIRDKGINSRAV